MSARASRWFAALLCTAACEDAPTPPDPPPLRVEFAGCAAVREGPVCEILAPSSLKFWVETPEDAHLSAEIDGATRAFTTASAQGGRRVTVDAPAGSREVALRAARNGAAAVFRLRLEPLVTSPALDEAEALRRRGQLDEAEAKLAPLQSDPSRVLRLGALRKRARIESKRGATPHAARLFAESLTEDRALGRVSDELHDRFALFHMHLYAGRRFADARAALSDVERLARDFPEGRVMASYYEGLLARETGDLRGALGGLRASQKAAARLGFEAQRVDALEVEASVLSQLGRHPDALAAMDEARSRLPGDASPCRRAESDNNLGWVALRTDADGQGLREPEPPLRAALEAFRKECPRPAEEANVLLNLGLYAMHRDRPEEARAHLDAARRAAPRVDARIEAWAAVLDGRIALAKPETRTALAPHERARAIGRAALLSDVELEGALGRARALEALGRTDDAERAYAEADALLDVALRAVPLGEGRETFLHGAELVTRLRVDFLLGRAEKAERSARDVWLREAALAAMRGKSRLLRALGCAASPSQTRREALDRSLARYHQGRAALEAELAALWRLPENRLDAALRAHDTRIKDLRAALDDALAHLCPHDRDATRGPFVPAPGEVTLVHLPTRSGWTGFVITPDAIVVHDAAGVRPDLPPSRLAAALFEPFAGALRGASRLRLITHPSLDRLDLHALPFDGAPLGARLPVVHGAGFDRPERPPSEGPLAALVVADPRGNLPGAREEARTVAAALRARGASVLLLEGEAATHAAVVAALTDPATHLFHFAGHGLYEGRDGWESALPLATGALAVADVLALARVPEQVVLSGCDTGRAGTSAASEGLGLGQAFVVAGARAVVAATRPIEDKKTLPFVHALYGDSKGPLDLVEALHRARRAAHEGDSPSDVASFRLLSP
ncbi:CHAT domain-containing protein [Polyangium mundeleinium]|uniref:CHAT domain-containing protein n=1 Tax=Polyangium mundeleinium TaxID=2995306 RepID=A0ABT5EQK1_9BACT|nr:CHAT domain-containing protein [Polyangium mundeleinium]MDC0744109.1 CHAT domain-containing protein [Polyangium mundeleinium]